MRTISLKAGLAATLIAVSSLGAAAAASQTPLQVAALENHDAMPSQVMVPQGKIAFSKQTTQNSGRYDKLEREAWKAQQ